MQVARRRGVRGDAPIIRAGQVDKPHKDTSAPRLFPVLQPHQDAWGRHFDMYDYLEFAKHRGPRFFGAYRHRQYTVPLCLGVRDPGVAELRSVRVV